MNKKAQAHRLNPPLYHKLVGEGSKIAKIEVLMSSLRHVSFHESQLTNEFTR